MSFFSRFMSSSVIALAGIAACIFINACAPQGTDAPANTATQPLSPAMQQSNSATSVDSPPASSLATVQITLPVIDAIMADDSTVAEMKSKLQLSDEQIQKLRTVAGQSVASLEEGDGAAQSRSTEAASKEALARVRETVGADKADSVINYLKEKWAGGEVASATPNSVPTDTRIVVNAPAYRMDIFRDGKLAKTYKIGIGYPEFPLPAGMRKATEIIFNPTWTPPDEPWVKGKFEPGKKVEAGSKDNPLGPIKIPIGSPSLIHGGKSASRLGNFASHGCVGLTNAQIQDFAAEISSIAGDPISVQEVKAYEKTKSETKNVKLGSPVQVELRYETIVVTADGKLSIYRDVYERGTNSEENLRRVLDAVGVNFESLPADARQRILEGLKQMAFDAAGDAVDTADAVHAGDKKAMKSQTDKVTRNVKGARQVVFDIAELKGKGYPVPVNLRAA